jgi:hypothetical protein
MKFVFITIAGENINLSNIHSLDTDEYIIDTTGLGALSSLIGLPVLRETYAPVIQRRLARLSNDPEKLDKAHSVFGTDQTKLQYIWTNLSRPAIMLARSFICFILSVYMALYVFYLIRNQNTELSCVAYMVSSSTCSSYQV